MATSVPIRINMHDGLVPVMLAHAALTSVALQPAPLILERCNAG
jgi:hypothetical protein